MERSRDRRTGDDLAYAGEEGLEICVDWMESKGAIVQILVRKEKGGTKGITRNLGAVVTKSLGLKAVPLSDLVNVNPVASSGENGGQAETGVDVPFNLSLTEEQKRRRGEVPLPYAHEGEGPGGDVMGLDWGDEEDEDDEEI